jgi:hypothetical protein
MSSSRVHKADRPKWGGNILPEAYTTPSSATDETASKAEAAAEPKPINDKMEGIVRSFGLQVTRQIPQIPGSCNGVNGNFQFVKDANGDINHSYFEEFEGCLILVPDQYRRLEKEKGRTLTEIGGAGVAFTREDVLEALECLKGTRVGVLGGDVLEVVNGRPRYAHDDWHVNRRPQEDLADFLNRSVAEAERYIRSYPDPGDGTIFYSPVISELGVISGPRN